MRLLNAEEVTGLLPMDEAIRLLSQAFPIISAGQFSQAHRQQVALSEGTGLMMGAAAHGVGFGCKVVSVVPGNAARGLAGVTGLVLLMDEVTGEPLALLEGAQLTALRTAALNGCAMDLLAREDARVGLLVGCGTQANAQAEAMTAVRDLRELRVLGREPSRTAAFVARLQKRLSLDVHAVSDAGQALEDVDLVTAATNSLTPVLPGERVPDGCHVSGIGSFRPDMQELDRALIERADIFVESREGAMAEAGELIAAAAKGVSRPQDWNELGEVMAGARPGRQDAQQVTFFKSVGHAVFDLVIAKALLDRAEIEGVGSTWQP